MPCPLGYSLPAGGRASPPMTSGAAATAVVESWQYHLRGLWRSGLRLEESLNFWWDRDDKLCPDFSGRRPVYRIPAEMQKSGLDATEPMSPEFAELLLQTPESERTGPVFKPLGLKGQRPTLDRVSRVISAIGEAAHIKVHTSLSTGKVKYASAHDLRRSFGTRWAMRIPAQVLQRMMRHSTIETTMRYYVDLDAEDVADVLWQATSNTFGNTSPLAGGSPESVSLQVAGVASVPE